MELFRVLFADLREGEWIELRHQPKPQEARRMVPSFYPSVAEAEAAVEELSGTGHLYFGIAPRSERKGTKQAIKRVQAIWADLDDTRDVPTWVLPPTFVVSSGYGLHLYWKLSESIHTTDAEQIVKAVGQAIGGDSVWDCSRIFRVPGSRNFKRSKKGALCEVLTYNDVTYKDSDFIAALKVDADTLYDIHSADLDKYKSRSEKDWAVGQALTRAGISPEATKAVFLYSPCGEKAREEPDHYLDYTLEKIARQEGEKAKKPAAEHKLTEMPDGYYVESAGGTKRLSSFVLTPKYVVHPENGLDDTDAFIVTVKSERGLESEAQLHPEQFISKEKLQRALKRVDCVWFGSDRELALLQHHLFQAVMERGLVMAPATSVLGSFKEYWVGTDRVLSRDNAWPVDASPIKYVHHGHPFVETDYTPAPNPGELGRRVFELLPRLNTPATIVPILGWTMACVFKEKLWSDLHTRFPILNLIGTRGSGKTVTVNFIALPLLGIVSHRSHESSTTTFVRLTMLGSTNGLPVSLTEFRADNAFRDATFAGQLRELYDHAIDSRGRSDLSTAQYPLLAPLVIDGEDPLQEAALLERVVQVRLRPETVAAGTDAFRAYREFKDLPVEQLAASYIQYALGTPPQLATAQALTEQALATVPIRSDRVLTNYTMITLGLLHMKEWAASIGVEFPWDMTPAGLYPLLEESLFNVVSKSGRTALLADDFVMDVLNAFAVKGMEAPFVALYEPKTGSVGIHMGSAYAWWVAERRRQGRPALEARAVRTQLDERVLDLNDPRVGQYVLKRDEVIRAGDKNYRMVVISLPAALEAGLDIPDKLPHTVFK